MGLNTAAVFDPLHHPQNAWKALPPMSNRRTNACATAVGKRIYICGGFGGDQSSDFPLDSAERYDPHLHQWETMPSMQSKRFNAASACMGPLLFIFGGSADRSDALKTVERFDARDGKCTWESMPSMSSKRMGAAATIFTEKGNSMPFVFGGHDGIACLDSVESLKPTGRPWLDGGKDGLWQAVPKMSMPRYCLAACVGKQDTKPKVLSSVAIMDVSVLTISSALKKVPLNGSQCQKTERMKEDGWRSVLVRPWLHCMRPSMVIMLIRLSMAPADSESEAAGARVVS